MSVRSRLTVSVVGIVVAGLAVDILPLAGLAAGRGGHVRVGLEDAPLGSTRSNLDWVRGARHAIEGARWLGKHDQANDWQREFDDFYQTFRRAAERDARTDVQGNRYVPIRMAKGEGILPQKAQWGFMHAVFPGKLFEPTDPLVIGNMAMLKAVERLAGHGRQGRPHRARPAAHHAGCGRRHGGRHLVRLRHMAGVEQGNRRRRFQGA